MLAGVLNMRISMGGQGRRLFQGLCVAAMLAGAATTQAAPVSLVPQSAGSGPYLVDLRLALGAGPDGAGPFTAFGFDLFFDSDALGVPSFSFAGDLEDSFLVALFPELCLQPAPGCMNVAGVYLAEGPYPSDDEFLLGTFTFELLAGARPGAAPTLGNLELVADPAPSPVPEPATGLLAAAGLLASAFATRRRRTA